MLRKPLCELDLHRWIDSSLAVLGKRQAGWDECLQGVEVKRLPHRIELAEKTNGLRKKSCSNAQNLCHEGGKDARSRLSLYVNPMRRKPSTFDSMWNMQKPSWCLVVNTKYFIPPLSISRTHSSAWKSVGLNTW